jgi:hypothetical protein
LFAYPVEEQGGQFREAGHAELDEDRPDVVAQRVAGDEQAARDVRGRTRSRRRVISLFRSVSPCRSRTSGGQLGGSGGLDDDDGLSGARAEAGGRRQPLGVQAQPAPVGRAHPPAGGGRVPRLARRAQDARGQLQAM